MLLQHEFAPGSVELHFGGGEHNVGRENITVLGAVDRLLDGKGTLQHIVDSVDLTDVQANPETVVEMQERMNLYGYVPEGPVVILGSGDLGLIMAKQLAEKGIAVTLVEKAATCGGMASILNGDIAIIREVCEECNIDVANYNSPGQIVISGYLAAVEQACARMKEAFAARRFSATIRILWRRLHSWRYSIPVVTSSILTWAVPCLKLPSPATAVG